MSLTAFLLILASACFHASWNFLTKAHRPSLSFNLMLQVTTLVLTIPFFVMLPVKCNVLPVSFWGLLTLSVVAETLSGVGLTFAYKLGDISISYPLARSIPVLLTALITQVSHIGETTSWVAMVGLAVLFVGCMILPQMSFSSLHWRNFLTPALLPICLAGVGTTGYTIADSIAGDILQDATLAAGGSRIVATGAYFCLVQVGLVISSFLTVLIGSPKGEFKTVARERYCYMAGVFNFGAYFLVLVSMGFVTNVSYVQAFRQVGLPLGVLAGFYFLHERLGWTKVVGLLLMIVGLLLQIF